MWVRGALLGLVLLFVVGSGAAAGDVELVNQTLGLLAQDMQSGTTTHYRQVFANELTLTFVAAGQTYTIPIALDDWIAALGADDGEAPWITYAIDDRTITIAGDTATVLATNRVRIKDADTGETADQAERVAFALRKVDGAWLVTGVAPGAA